MDGVPEIAMAEVVLDQGSRIKLHW